MNIIMTEEFISRPQSDGIKSHKVLTQLFQKEWIRLKVLKNWIKKKQKKKGQEMVS